MMKKVECVGGVGANLQMRSEDTIQDQLTNRKRETVLLRSVHFEK